MKRNKKAHLIGICGAGMSAVAVLLKDAANIQIPARPLQIISLNQSRHISRGTKYFLTRVTAQKIFQKVLT